MNAKTTPKPETRVRRLQNLVIFWRTRAMELGYHADRKAKWRAANPDKYAEEKRRNLARLHRQNGAPDFHVEHLSGESLT